MPRDFWDTLYITMGFYYVRLCFLRLILKFNDTRIRDRRFKLFIIFHGFRCLEFDSV